MDIALHETLNGGDIAIQNGDIYTTNAIWTQIYLALFGGNIEQSTADDLADDAQRFDFWGNQFLQNDPDEQLNSLTERTLNEVALNSAGRLAIQRAVETDLDYLRKVGTVSVDVSIPGLNTVQIDITITEPDRLNETQYRIIWRATQTEPISGEIEEGGGVVVSQWILANGTWNDLGLWIDSEVWNDN